MTTEPRRSHAPGIDSGPELRDHLISRQPLTFRHSLAEHPLLGLEAVARLAGGLRPDQVVCEDAQRPLVFADGAPEPGRSDRGADLVRTLRDNSSWLTLLNIEEDPRYRELIDDELDALAGRCDLPAAHLKRRMGFVFASSPHSVTGAHFDIEHSLMLQLRGHRTLTFGQFADGETREREIRRYWNGSYGKLQNLPPESFGVDVRAGVGVYIPPFRPHWLHNSDETSLSLTITFFTRENEREVMAQVFNERARKLHLTPRPVGVSPRRDQAKAALTQLYARLRRSRIAAPAPR